MIYEKLRKNPVETYKAIFGPEVKSVSESEMRYPDGLVVTLDGHHKGHWYSFTKGVGGGPLKAIKDANQLDLVEAAKLGAKIAGLNADDVRNFLVSDKLDIIPPAKPRNQNDHRIERKRHEEVARDLWMKSVPLKGTVGEVYLEKHRNLPKRIISKLAFKFLDEGTTYAEFEKTSQDYVEKSTMAPMILVPVEDSEGQVVGVQRIYVNKKTGAKLAKRHKFSKGNLKGNAAVVFRGNPNSEVLYLAEGPETAATVGLGCGAFENFNPVLASLSIGNIVNMASAIGEFWAPKKVVIAADNDGPVASANAALIFKRLSDQLMASYKIPVFIVQPELEPGCDKIDFNDVLSQRRVDALQRQLKNLTPISDFLPTFTK